MAQRRISMKKIREIMRLRFENGLSKAIISKSVGISRSAVGDCLARALRAGIQWPIPDDMDDSKLEAAVYPRAVNTMDSRKIASLPDWGEFHKELMRKGVTRRLLWEEHISMNPDGYEYSRFCEIYRDWLKKRRISMHQNHKAGEKLFIDYAGQTMKIHDQQTGEVRTAQIFVASWGASNYCAG